ncbi:NAD-dependent epimerase/dehydratase family protein [Nocardioides lijunqiniae]|uniref:NAD-dependent epimerase/dehydratase family protein n=1 Tax=Nocardioides lijunqiniae TaxID=2760832 RepID=UPI0018787DCE
MSGVALVTGGSGYFGSLLVDALQRDGLEVRVLDVVDAPDRPDGVRLFHGDVRDEELVGRAVAGADMVFHNVAQVPLARDRALFDSVNVEGTAVVIRACERVGVAKLVHTSSSAVFGIPSSNPVTRATSARPVEAYGQAKLDAELLVRAAVSRGLDATIVRPRTILGHGRLGIFGILFDWIADGASVPLLGDGTNVYQFVHAEDLASACLLAARRPGPAVYNIGAEEFGTMGEAVGRLCAHAGTGSRVRHLPVGPTTRAMEWSARLGLTPFAPYHWIMYSRSLWFDVADAKAELDWSARWSTDAMFESSYEWFLQHRDAEPEGGSAHRRSAKQGLLRVAKRVL